MRPIPIERKVAIEIAISLGALLVWLAPIPALKIAAPAPAPLAATPSLPTDNVPPAMTEVTARPMFAKTRRPPPPVQIAAAVAPARPVPTTTGMVLLGILRDHTKVVALVTLPGDQHPRRVVPGASLGDWVVEEISTDRLFLQSGSTNAELVLPRPVPSQTQPSGPQTLSPFSRVP